MQYRKLGAALALVVLLVACGGGGGGSGGVGPPDDIEGIGGRVSVLANDGSQTDAGAGVTVSLVDLDAAGNVGATLQTTTTDVRGDFTLDLPAGRLFGPRLALVTADGAGGVYRALVLGRYEAQLGAASEAVARELFAAIPSFGAAGTSDRLALFQALATVTLRLTPAGSNVPAAAVGRLREWLAADPATDSVFASLRATGAMPVVMGDVGGLAGVGRAAVEYEDTPGGTRKVVTLPVAGSAGDYTVNDSSLGTTFETARLRLENDGALDGVTRVSQYTGDTVTQVLFDLIGPHRERSFLTGRDVGYLNVDIQRPTTGYDFDGDGAVDQVRYRVFQLSRGVESVAVFGTTLPALKTEFQTELTLLLSNGGQLKVAETRVEWSLPFAGPVRIDSTAIATDVNGVGTTLNATSVAVRAAMNDVSWPGRLRLAAVPITIPAGYLQTSAIGATSDLGVSLHGIVDDGTAYPDDGLSWRDAKGLAASADRTVPSLSSSSRTFVSPDGSKIYVALNQLPPDPVFSANIAIDPVAAAAASAVIVRYDARTLAEEARIPLPPRASALQPGLAFPRFQVLQLIVSPLDPTVFVVSGVDVMLVRGTAPQPQVVSSVFAEAVGSDGHARLGGYVPLRGWDGASDELWLEREGPRLKIVPVATDGLHFDALRDGIPVFFKFSATEVAYDRITADRVYADGYKIAVDKASGAVLRRLADLSDSAIDRSRCDLRDATVWCFNGDTLFRFDRDLAEQARSSLQSDLRLLAKGPVPRGLEGNAFVPADGTMVFVSANAGDGDRTSVFRLHFP